MTQEHPITPRPEIIEEWIELSRPQKDRSPNPNVLATHAARWGADQELDACCEWFLLEGWHPDHPNKLRASRRPNPPSLKEQALALIQSVEASDDSAASWDFSVIRRALESLPN